MPPGSLPSLAPENHAGNPFTTEPLVTAKPGELTRTDPIVKHRPIAKPRPASSPAIHQHPKPRTELQPDPQIRRESDPSPQAQLNPSADLLRWHEQLNQGQADPQATPGIPLPPWPPNLLFPPPEGFPQPVYYEHPSVGLAFAVPYYFEPVPLSPSQIAASESYALPPAGEGVDPEALAAMWCLIEQAGEAGRRPQGEEEAGPSGTREEPAIWAQVSEAAVERWAETGERSILRRGTPHSP